MTTIFGVKITKKQKKAIARAYTYGSNRIRVKTSKIKEAIRKKRAETPTDRAIKQYEKKGYYTTDLKGRFSTKGGIRIKHYNNPLQRNTAPVEIQHQKPTRQISLDTAIKRRQKMEKQENE